MKNWLKAIAISALGIMVMSGAAMAAAPNTMAYQGRLTDENGNAMTGQVLDVTFTIYDDTTAGRMALWTDIDTLTCDNNGVFTQELGLEVPIPSEIFDGAKRWLGIQVGTDDEMEPLQLLTSVPYALSTMGPGIAYKEVLPGNTFIPFPSSSTTSLDSIKIDVPAPGYVNVMVTVSYLFNHSGSTGIYSQIQDQEDYIQYSQFGTGLIYLPGITAGQYYWPLSLNKVFYVATPGEKTFYFNTIFSSGYDASDTYFDLQLTAIYYPTSYGTVSVSKSSPLKASGNNESPETPGGIVPTE